MSDNICGGARCPVLAARRNPSRIATSIRAALSLSGSFAQASAKVVSKRAKVAGVNGVASVSEPDPPRAQTVAPIREIAVCQIAHWFIG
jgi:hypothetical protein